MTVRFDSAIGSYMLYSMQLTKHGGYKAVYEAGIGFCKLIRCNLNEKSVRLKLVIIETFYNLHIEVSLLSV